MEQNRQSPKRSLIVIGILAAIILKIMGWPAILIYILLGVIIGWLVGELLALKYRVQRLEQGTQKSPEQPPVAATRPLSPEITVRPAPTQSQTVEEPFITATTPPKTPPPKETATTDFESSLKPLFQKIKNFFTTGNVVAKAGIIILFLGFGFLLEYAANSGWLPIQVRMLATVAGAVVLLVLGLRLSPKKRAYGLSLQGGAIAIFYLTIVFAYWPYHLISPTTIFTLGIIVSAAAIILALKQDALSLAVFGFAGGFIAPHFAPFYPDQQAVLFGFYTLLNLSILTIAWFKWWRVLNVMGFFATFIFSAAWGYFNYRTQYFLITEIFLIIYFLMYVAVPLLNALRQPVAIRGYVDTTLIFGTPFICFMLQQALLWQRYGSDFSHTLAISSMGLAIFYCAITAICFYTPARKHLENLGQIYLGLALLFATLFVPLEFSVRNTITIWSIEGAALIWIGLRQHRWLPQFIGFALQAVAGLLILRHISLEYPVSHFVLNATILNLYFVSISGFLSAYCFFHYNPNGKNENKALACNSLAIWGLMTWTLAGILFNQNYFPEQEIAANLIYFAGTSLITWELGRWLQWRVLENMCLVIFAVIAFATLLLISESMAPFAGINKYAWLFAIASCYFILFRGEKLRHDYFTVLHCLTFWIVIVLITLQFYETVLQFLTNLIYRQLGVVLPSLIAIYLIPLCYHLKLWPVARDEKTYPTYIANPILAVLILWSITINFIATGDVSPIPYLPIINPLDISLILILLMFGARLQKAAKDPAFPSENMIFFSGLLAALCFLWLNAVLIRSLHIWFNIPFNFDALYQSTLVQASLSVFWGIITLALMLIATWRGWRVIWLTGATLTGIVIIKLFLIDMANSNTVDRIITFIAVGIILLLAGYFSPLPPKKN